MMMQSPRNQLAGLPVLFSVSPFSAEIMELGKQQPESPQKEPRIPVRDPSSQKPQIKEPTDKEQPMPRPTPSLSGYTMH